MKELIVAGTASPAFTKDHPLSFEFHNSEDRAEIVFDPRSAAEPHSMVLRLRNPGGQAVKLGVAAPPAPPEGISANNKLLQRYHKKKTTKPSHSS